MEQDLLYLVEIFQDKDVSYLKNILKTQAKGDLGQAIELILNPVTLGVSTSRQTSISSYLISSSKPVSSEEPIVIDDEIDDLDSTDEPSSTKEGTCNTISTKKIAPVFSQPIRNNSSIEVKPRKTINRAKLLYDPRDVSSALPTVSFHTKFLPAELASELLNEVLNSKAWHNYRMFLFEREVESLHLTSSYCSAKAGSFPEGEIFYNGKLSPPSEFFSSTMEKAASAIQDFVNEERLKRPRHKLDLPEDHPWRANFSVGNLYPTSKSTVGWHTDTLTYLGVRPIIASLSLGVTREFRLRKVTPGSDNSIYSVPLPHNSLLIMWGPTQEEYKHCVPPIPTLTPHSISGFQRVNLTFRYYPEKFGPKNTPLCACGIPCDFRAVNQSSANLGRYFWMCAKPEADGSKGCGLFEYVDF